MNVVVNYLLAINKTMDEERFMKAQIGDWIRFYQQGELVIGIVNYITEHKFENQHVYSTDQGPCDEDEVLEVRSKS